MTTATCEPTLSKNYTMSRPIGLMTATARNTLELFEFAWVSREWSRFEGGEEDYNFNVIMTRITPVTKTKIWVVDRDGPESAPMLMLPEDY